MNILSFVRDDNDRATLTAACKRLVKKEGSPFNGLHHFASDDFTEIPAKLGAAKPSLLVIDYGWSDVYSVDDDLHKYIAENKIPVLLVANYVPSHIVPKGFPEGTAVISTSTDTMLSHYLVDALDIMLRIDEKKDIADAQTKMNDIHAKARSYNDPANYDVDFSDEVHAEVTAIRNERNQATKAFGATPIPGMT